uniref:urinary protein 2-like n=1 Tax=Myodes glareolus TaxID=447135 RepID=UPI0020202456|nr:urinary protein 2-like [Myodes glareolus]
MGKFMLLLLLLGALTLVFFQAQARICMTCSMFMNGKCVAGEGKCTMEEDGACSTRDIYLFSGRDGFLYNHTVLECSKPCQASTESYFHLKMSSFCCQSQDFCNRYKGKIVNEYAN